MYYGYLDYQRKKFENQPDLYDRSYQRFDRSELGSEMILTLWCLIIILLFLISGLASYQVTKEVSPDASHVHWKLFGKEMISEDGKILSHHFIHPEKCPICKKIQTEKSK